MDQKTSHLSVAFGKQQVNWRAGSYLQRNHRDISRFVGPRNARGVDHWVWSVTRERVTWLSTRNPRSTLLPHARARASRTISRTDRMPSETTRLAVDFFYLLHFKLTPEVPTYGRKIEFDKTCTMCTSRRLKF